MVSLQRSKRSDNKQRTVDVRWGIFCENLTSFFLFLRAVLNIPIQTHIISPWLLFCKMIISHLEYGPLVIDVALTSNKSYKRQWIYEIHIFEQRIKTWIRKRSLQLWTLRMIRGDRLYRRVNGWVSYACRNSGCACIDDIIFNGVIRII